MNNQIFIVFDSLRWDLFKSADIPFLKSLGPWRKAYTPGVYTLPAHMSFFAGKLPTTFDQEDYYDTIATRFDKKRKVPFRNTKQLWRLAGPEMSRPAKYIVQGESIIAGFREQGFLTIGTGGVNWFNPDLPAGKLLTEHFEKFRFFGGPNYACHVSSEQQIEWALDELQKTTERPYFLFMNFGETHHRYVYKDCPWDDTKDPYGNSKECKHRQRMCIAYLSRQVEKLLTQLKDYDLVMCSDHGDAMGESGLWDMGFIIKKLLKCRC